MTITFAPARDAANAAADPAHPAPQTKTSTFMLLLNLNPGVSEAATAFEPATTDAVAAVV